MDTTIQNNLSIETEKILYNTLITHAALNMDWMATVETLDDLQHTLEIRLKFWKFGIEKQMYSLVTHVELPHEIGVTAIEFSSKFSVDNLLCATAGKDNYVKIWSLEDGKMNSNTLLIDDEIYFENTFVFQKYGAALVN